MVFIGREGMMSACITEEHLVMSVLEFHMVLEFVVDRGREITKITLTNKPRARRQLFSSTRREDSTVGSRSSAARYLLARPMLSVDDLVGVHFGVRLRAW